MLPAGAILKYEPMRIALSIVIQFATWTQRVAAGTCPNLMRRLSRLLPQAVILMGDKLFRDAFWQQ